MSDNAIQLLTSSGSFKHKVSSILNGSSDFASKGTSQFIFFEFAQPVQVTKLRIMFQGGFVAHDCLVEVGESTGAMEPLHHFQVIADSNDTQDFDIPLSDSQPPEGAAHCRYLRLTFRDFSDFYGRLIIYSLEVFGRIAPPSQ